MDDALRELERLAAQGDPGAIERLELARRRAGFASTPIVLPALGEATVEVTLAEWYVGPGDVVKRDQVIAMLETDKVSVELVAPDDGVLSQVAFAPGDVAPLGATLAQVAHSLPPDLEAEALHDALVADIIAAPDDVGLRLEYARLLVETAARGRGIRPWGAETTRLRGESIRLHHEGGAQTYSSAQRLMRTALDLVPFQVPGPLVEGGFLASFNGPTASLCEDWGRLVERAPLTALRLSNLSDATPILSLPRLEQVRWLTLGPWVAAAAVEALGASGRLRVRRLTLRSVALPAWLAGSTVERLELDDNVPTEAALREILSAVPGSVREVIGPRLVPHDR